MGKSAEVETTEVDKEYRVKKTFAAYSIRATTYCKYKIWNAAELTTDRFKHNNFNINISVENLDSLYLIWMPKDTEWGNQVRVKRLEKALSKNTF